MKRWHFHGRFGEMQLDRRFEGSESHLVAAQGAKDWVDFESRNETRFTGDDSGLRPAEELITAETNKARALPKRFLRGRLVFIQTERLRGGKSAAAEIDDERQSPAASEISDLFVRRLPGETSDVEIALVHPQ